MCNSVRASLLISFGTMYLVDLGEKQKQNIVV